MQRREFLVGSLAGIAAATVSTASIASTRDSANDRAYQLNLLTRIAAPVLGAMAGGRLHTAMKPELSPSWDGRNPNITYLECFARLVAGIAPWLELPDDGSAEGRLRARLRQQALASFTHSVDPSSPDYLLWREGGQPLVDSAFFTNALLRAPKRLWNPLDAATKTRIVNEIKGLRRVSPPYGNWLLFAAMNEAFLLSTGEQWDPVRLGVAIRKMNEWYVGDGWYADGPRFHFDYYGSFVIHPMLAEILDVLDASDAKLNGLDIPALREQAWKRMQRYGIQLERMIAPDGTFPPIGRSLTYRTAAFQPLALLALRKKLPPPLPEGQVRAATMAAQRAVFRHPSNFGRDGFLTLGFAGHQPDLADPYSNNGSMYLASTSLLALGLPANDSFWTAPALPWTAKRAWSGQPFPRDYYVDY